MDAFLPYLADFLIVVFGVFLAFYVANQSEKRKIRRRSAKLLNQVVEEMESNIDAFYVFYESLGPFEEALRKLKDGEKVDEDNQSVLSLNSFYYKRSILDLLTYSGFMENLDDVQIGLIARTYAAFDAMKEYESRIIDAVSNSKSEPTREESEKLHPLVASVYQAALNLNQQIGERVRPGLSKLRT